MAIEFARVRYVARSNGGNACRSAAYNARSDVRCARTGERFYFAHRDGLLHHEVLLPDGADPRFFDAETLWNQAQAMERRKDSQEARELLLALPHDPEISLEQCREMCEEFAREHFVSKGVAVQVDIHAPHEGEVNIHAHLLITTRRLEGDRFSNQKARDLDPEIRTLRGGRKAVTEAERWGALWRDHQNRTFERLGLGLRVDEIGFVPQTHEGPIRFRAVPTQADERLETARGANVAAAHDPSWILQRLTEKRATFTELDIERLIRKHVAKTSERAEIRARVLAAPEVLPLHERDSGEFTGLYTTTEVRDQERDVMSAADRIRQVRKPVDERQASRIADEYSLDVEQRAAFAKATGTDGLVVIEGLAGAGKSHSLKAIREAHEQAGWSVVGLAPTNVVAEDLRRSGFQRGSTAHLELYWQENKRHDRAPAWDRKTAVVVEEAAMLDTRIYARLMRHAAETGAKVILAGDDRQLSSVSRGGMFTALKEKHGSVVISKVRRQQEDWQREASECFASGRMAEGLRSYAERGHVHWSMDIVESKARLLSDWDQASRERPDVNRFVYASTNAEVNELNRAIRDIRVRRGDIEAGIEVSTVRGSIRIGEGDRLQFHGNDRKAGIYNGSLGTVRERQGTTLTVTTDTGRVIRFDAEKFDQFGLGYAGTVYRGQGKTQTEVYALYDNAFAWNARTAYVGLTRHRSTIELYVSRDLAADEIALVGQMSRHGRDEASLAWATEAEVVQLRGGDKQRGGRDDGRTSGDAGPKDPRHPPRDAMPREAVNALRQADLPTYAANVHGYTVLPARDRGPGEFTLTRQRDGRRDDRLQVLRTRDGHWIWRNADRPSERGDILDLAKREGAPDLRAAREAVQAWVEKQAMAHQPHSRRRQEEDRPPKEVDASDPEASAKRAVADDERCRAILGAEHEDRVAGIAADEEARLAAVRASENERLERLDRQFAQAREAEQRVLAEALALEPRHHEPFTAERAAEARTALDPSRHGSSGPPLAGSRMDVSSGPIGVPESAQARYIEALAQHYDPRDPYASLAQASLAEAAAWMRQRHELDQRIAAETNLERRDALTLRRDIEHSDYLAQTHDRIGGLSRAMGGDAHDRQADDHRDRAAAYREQAAQARRTWEDRGLANPELYPPLDGNMEKRRAEVGRADEDRSKAVEGAPLPDNQTSPQEKIERSSDQERVAMSRINLPEYARDQHGYDLSWRDDAHTRAILRKGEDQLRASQARDGTWSYESRSNPNDRGDILEFEARRGARTYTNARENIRPTLEHSEQERGPLHLQPVDVKSHGHDRDGPDHDPNDRRKGRGR